MSDKIFWFILAAENLIAGVFVILYHVNYRKEPAALFNAVIFILYSAWFILLAGILKAPDDWLLWIGVALIGSFPPFLFVLIRRALTDKDH